MVHGLTQQVRGPVFLPEDEGYDGERSGYQTHRQHRPSVIVGALDAEDVRAAVEFANTRGLAVAVQATGHGLAAATDGGVLISTRRMNGVQVDPAARTARVEAGTTWAPVIEAAAEHGLAPLSGSTPGVGAVSYTLGGGLGLLARQYGYAADHVRSIDIVTADARHRHVTAETDPDLFWALRGGGANFGVVTGMEVDLVPVTRLYGGGMFFDGELADGVLRTYLDWTRETVPEEMNSSVALIVFPDVPGVPELFRGRYVASVHIAYTGDAEAGERLVEPLRALGPRLADTLGDMAFTDSDSIHSDPTEPHAYHGDTAMLGELDASAVRPIIDITGPEAPMMCVVQLKHLGGALARTPEVPNAVGHRDARYLLGVLSPLEGAGTSAVRAVHEKLLTVLEPWTLGRFLNSTFGADTGADRTRSAYNPGDYQRLTRIKADHDPANLFRLNRNIAPEGGRR